MGYKHYHRILVHEKSFTQNIETVVLLHLAAGNFPEEQQHSHNPFGNRRSSPDCTHIGSITTWEEGHFWKPVK